VAGIGLILVLVSELEALTHTHSLPPEHPQT
jgi:hypothetical protein